MVYLAKLDITTPWILTSLVGLILVAIIGLGGYSPTLRWQITTAENDGPNSVDYAAVARRGNNLGALIILLVVSITYLMAIKPPLWG